MRIMALCDVLGEERFCLFDGMNKRCGRGEWDLLV